MALSLSDLAKPRPLFTCAVCGHELSAVYADHGAVIRPCTNCCDAPTGPSFVDTHYPDQRTETEASDHIFKSARAGRTTFAELAARVEALERRADADDTYIAEQREGA